MAADEVHRDFPKQRTVRHHSLGKMRNRNVCCPLEIGSHWRSEIAGDCARGRLIASWYR
jgi:hypothetical protein